MPFSFRLHFPLFLLPSLPPSPPSLPLFTFLSLSSLLLHSSSPPSIHRISLWHQQQMTSDIFLGQIHLSLSSVNLSQPHSYQAWYRLCPRSDHTPVKIGSIRLLITYHEDYILASHTYQPLLGLILNCMTESVSLLVCVNCVYKINIYVYFSFTHLSYRLVYILVSCFFSLHILPPSLSLSLSVSEFQ